MNLKCEPDVAAALREFFPAVIPAWHMNKVHWNTVLLDASVPRDEVKRLVDMSYALVVKKLKRGARLSLETHHGKDALYALTPSVFA
jgi:predicted DNA-binding protein (MmcQ/YjbR family)